MKRLFVALTLMTVAGAASLAIAGAGHRISIHVSTFRSTKGMLRCRLYSRADGFPGKPPFDAEVAVAVTGTTATCAFSGVTSGKYAVALFHDENGNGKLDTNILGIPREGVGVSNNRLRSLGPPKWDDASFVVKGDVDLDVTLRY